MAFRDENEALRAQVNHLQEELAHFKGDKRAKIRERDHSGKVKRQTILLVIGAIMGSLGLGLVCFPMVIIPFVERDAQESSPASIAQTSYTSYQRVRFVANFDATRTVSDRDVYDSEYAVENFAVADRDHPTVLYYCGGYSCSIEIEELLRDAGTSHEFGGASTSTSREIEGTVAVIDEYGSGVYEIPSHQLTGYASSLGVPVNQLRVVRIQRERPSPLPAAITMIAIALFVGFLLWAGVILHQILAKRPVEMPRPDDVQIRDAGLTLVLSLVSCRLYELYWIFASTSQLRRITGRPDLIPALDLMLTIATLGLWALWVFYRNAEAVDEALSDMGEHSTHSQTTIMLIAGSFACGICHWFLIYKLQEAYNQLAIEKADVSEL